AFKSVAQSEPGPSVSDGKAGSSPKHAISERPGSNQVLTSAQMPSFSSLDDPYPPMKITSSFLAAPRFVWGGRGNDSGATLGIGAVCMALGPSWLFGIGTGEGGWPPPPD